MRHLEHFGIFLLLLASAGQVSAQPAAAEPWLFSETLFSVLTYGALFGTIGGFSTLVYMIFRDRKDGNIW